MTLYQKRIRKAKFIASLLSMTSFVRMIALTGSLAKGKTKPESDIDFFIVTKPGRIWTSRFLTVSLLKILGQYRDGHNIAGKICSNRWQTEDSLEIMPPNLYHGKEYSQIIPLFETENVYQKYIKANRWMKRFNLKFKSKDIKIKNNFLYTLIRKMGERILSGQLGGFLEEKLKNFQKKRILRDRRTYGERARIIIKDQMLCFHPEGR